MKTHTDLFSQIISLENLFLSWREFRRGKRNKLDVQIFERNLEDNLFQLHFELKTKTYRHSDYTPFTITDPKIRRIHKAQVRDRVVHHAIYRVLYPIFDRSFIFDSYSCRLGKGTHKAVRRLAQFTRKVSQNYTRPCFALKCDINKFFDSVSHNVLLDLVKKKIKDQQVMSLIEEIVGSYPQAYQIERERERERERESKTSPHQNSLFSACGTPIGNLTSQLFANIYLNELDQFIKHQLKIKYYLRYTDDFIIILQSESELSKLIPIIRRFLSDKLQLELHPHKITIRKLCRGIDFLGYVVLPHYTVLRTKTKRRMLKRVNANNLPSYLGLLQHCNGYQLEQINRSMVMNRV